MDIHVLNSSSYWVTGSVNAGKYGSGKSGPKHSHVFFEPHLAHRHNRCTDASSANPIVIAQSRVSASLRKAFEDRILVQCMLVRHFSVSSV